MPGQVVKDHAKWEEKCDVCHKLFDKSAQDGLCQRCHKDVASDVAQKKGFHGKRKGQEECHICHTEHKGRQANIAPFNMKTFDHTKTDFLLLGGHTGKKVQCRSCHKPEKKYRKAPSQCYACHRKDDVHKGKLGTGCANCHTEKHWKDLKFDHRKTRFPLRGKHQKVKCEDCHQKQRFKNTPRTCYACHKKDDYHRGVLGKKCLECHAEQNWKVSTFDHARDTKFVLKGKHRTAKCEGCHKVPVAKVKTKSTCFACHRKADTHKGRFGKKCATCHNEKSWTVNLFDHTRDTKYPLRWKHRKVKCVSCHKGNLYKDKISTKCLACHRKDDTHRGRFGPKCATCHTEKTWKVSTFDHNRDTKFELKGKHVKGKDGQVKCESCHKESLYDTKLATNCYACHKKDDKHRGQEGTKCEECHNEQKWKDVRVDHSLTRFPLLGNHQLVPCKDCHSTTAFKDAPMACVKCHIKDDVHKRRLGPQCDSCHNSRDWKLWDFDHNRRTKFILDGGHDGLDCLACHTEPSKTKLETPNTCNGCHRADDIHEGDFGPQCERCHFTSNWEELKPKARFSR